MTNMLVELALHEKDIALNVSRRLQMAEEGFFRLLSRAKHEGGLVRHKDLRALLLERLPE
jgi:hypothetical protein